jgi:hypothetical protein
MKVRVTVLGFCGFLLSATRGEAARPQASPSPQDLRLYAGEISGGGLSQQPFTATRPRLNDANTAKVRFGVRYYLRDSVFLDQDARYRDLTRRASVAARE